MSSEHSLFRSWIPQKVITPLMILCLFPHLILLSMFNMNSTFTASFLDVDVDDLQFLFAIAYANMVCGMFLSNRFFHAFNVRNYLLIMTMLNIVVLFCMTLTNNSSLILILRVIQGPLTLLEGTILIPVLMFQLKHTHARFIAYFALYTYMMTSDKLTTSIVKFAIEHYTHNMMIYAIIGTHLIALLIYVFTLRAHRIFPKKPLYQLNVAGVILMLIGLVSGAYCLIYGKRYQWFESPQIVIACAMCFIFCGLFVLHQLTSKRPLFHFEVLKSENVWLGIGMFFCFYLMRAAMSNLYQVMNVVWKWPWENVLYVQYYNVIGTVIGVLTAYILYTRRMLFKNIFLIGFSLLSLSMLWMSTMFYPDVTTFNIIGSLFLEGIAQGIIFTPLVFYMSGSVHPSMSSHVVQIGTASRYWTLTIGFSIMQNSIWYLSQKYEWMISHDIDLTSAIFQQQWAGKYDAYTKHFLPNEAWRLSLGSIQQSVANEALLISNREIFFGLFVFSATVTALVYLYRPLQTFIYKRLHPVIE